MQRHDVIKGDKGTGYLSFPALPCQNIKYRDSEGLRGKLVNRYLSLFINLKKYLSRDYPVPVK